MGTQVELILFDSFYLAPWNSIILCNSTDGESLYEPNRPLYKKKQETKSFNTFWFHVNGDICIDAWNIMAHIREVIRRLGLVASSDI